MFATETLALGVNMPARSVVIEKLTKLDGVARRFDAVTAVLRERGHLDIKQAVDLLGQISAVAGPPLAATARQTAKALNRGVVAASGAVADP